MGYRVGDVKELKNKFPIGKEVRVANLWDFSTSEVEDFLGLKGKVVGYDIEDIDEEDGKPISLVFIDVDLENGENYQFDEEELEGSDEV